MADSFDEGRPRDPDNHPLERHEDRGPRPLRWIRRNGDRTWLLLISIVVALLAGKAFAVSDSAKVAAHESRVASFAAGQAAGQARQIAAASAALAVEIQQNRLDLIRRQCNEQNANNLATLRATRRAARRSPRQPGQTRAQRRAGIAAFLIIIKAEIPYRDCDRLVAEARLAPATLQSSNLPPILPPPVRRR